MDKNTHPYFVPDSQEGNRRDTAVLLVGTAAEFEIPQREVAATRGGFRISQNVYDALGWNEDEAIDGSVGEDESRQAPGEVVTGQVQIGQRESDTGSDEADLTGAPKSAPIEGEADVDTDADETDQTDDETVEALPYDEWDYADLKTEIANREIETDDKKAETLVAALIADDEANANADS